MARRAPTCVIVALAAVWAVPSAARACDCKPVWPLERAFEYSAVVFEGRAGEAREDADGSSIRTDFEVLRVFKGEACPTVEIVTLGRVSSCTKRYDPAETYLIYAYARDGELNDGFCSRSRPASEASEDFEQFGAGTPPACAAAVDGAARTPPEPEPEDADEPPRSEAPAHVDAPGRVEDTPAAAPEGARAPKQRGCAASIAGSSPEGVGGLIVLLLAMIGRRRPR